MQELVTIILADESNASNKYGPEPGYEICGAPCLTYITDAVKQIGTDSIIMVYNNMPDESNQISDTNLKITTVKSVTEILNNQISINKNKHVLLIIGANLPAISGETLKDAFNNHISGDKQITVLTSYNSDSNSGIYYLNIDTFLSIFSQHNSENNTPGSAIENALDSFSINIYKASDSSELIRVHDSVSLNEAEEIIRKRIIRSHMENGVVFHLPDTSIIHKNVKIGRNTVINPGTILEGDTYIGENCEIGPYARIQNSRLGDNVKFMNSVMIESRIGDNTTVGPFAYIRPNCDIGNNIKIGDFVEVKNSIIGDNTKVPHLSYVGDADVGKFVNFGCGSVLVNYDGKKKHRTTVCDHAFIGCNVNLVSPVTVKEYAYIAAGSTITEEVPEYALAIARSRQTIIENWVKRKGLDKK